MIAIITILLGIFAGLFFVERKDNKILLKDLKDEYARTKWMKEKRKFLEDQVSGLISTNEILKVKVGNLERRRQYKKKTL